VRIVQGRPAWAPCEGVQNERVFHFWDYPRWGAFELDGVCYAYHRHEELGPYLYGPSIFTYRVLDEADARALDLPEREWGREWTRVYEAWRARTPARWWCITDDDCWIVDCGEVPAGVDDDRWARELAIARGLEQL
jgi:hypothetical protein